MKLSLNEEATPRGYGRAHVTIAMRLMPLLNNICIHYISFVPSGNINLIMEEKSDIDHWCCQV